jgi:hypothetical protein
VNGFSREGALLVCDGVPLDRIASAEGTPLYVYSAATIAARFRAIDEAFAGYPHAIHYALKANSTLAIARLLRDLGSAADANSSGEIDNGATRQMIATGTYSFGPSQNVTGTAVWSSSASSVATVSSTGLVSCKRRTSYFDGNATISATIGTTKGSISITCDGVELFGDD